MKPILWRGLAAVLLMATMGAASPPGRPPDGIAVRLYAIDCGTAHMKDLGPFSDGGQYEGQSGVLKTPCFLIRHPLGDLLWEGGLGDRYAGRPGGVELASLTAMVPERLSTHLQRLSITPDDIDLFAFSHGHADHLGAAQTLRRAVWLVNAKELRWMSETPTPPRVNASLLADAPSSARIEFEGDYDVFGDGSVRILSAPGHTPGHQVLLVRLARSGPVLLSGDLYHSRENRRRRFMPVFNVNREETFRSMDRIEAMVEETGARVVIHHAIEDFDSLPTFPDYLD